MADEAEKPSEDKILDGVDACAQAIQTLFENSQQSIYIFTDCLDPLLFDRSASCDALSQMLRRHRQCFAKILIRSTRDLSQRKHQLLDLARRLPSKIEIRGLNEELDEGPQDFIVADHRAIYLQHEAGVYQAYFDTEATAQARSLLERFAELWERQSHEIADLRFLQL